MAISFHTTEIFEQSAQRKTWAKLPVKPLKTKQWLNSIAVKYEKRIANLNVIFCSDNELLEINEQFLSHTYYTDIITFDYSVDSKLIGELYISLDSVEANANRFHSSKYNELYRVIAHGLLHMCGENDHLGLEKDSMRQAECSALGRLSDYNIYL